MRTLTRRRHSTAGRCCSSGTGVGGRRDRPRRHVPAALLLPSRTPILMPNDIVVDSPAPAVRVTGTTRPLISPDNDNRFDGLTPVHARRAGADDRLRRRPPARAHEAPRGAAASLERRLRGRRLPAGRYELTLPGRPGRQRLEPRRDPRSNPLHRAARERIEAVAGTRFGVRVSTDLRRFRWSPAPAGPRRGGCSGSARRSSLAVTGWWWAGTAAATRPASSYDLATSLIPL